MVQRIAVVILNWNGQSLLEKFLPSVIQHSTEADIIVVDNGSTDNSISFLIEQFPTVRVIELDQNYGFCSGYNLALQHIESDYYVLLNSDVEVTANWLTAPTQLMDANENIAVCQPKILSYNDKSSFEYAGAAGGYLDKYGFPFCKGRLFYELEKDVGQYAENAPIQWATGAALFIRSEIFHELKGFDSNFFAHMEEIDLCWRVKNIGKEIWYCADSTVYHIGAATLDKSNPQKTYYNFRNGLALVFKNTPKKRLFKTIFVRLILDGIAGVYFLFQGNPAHMYAVIRAHFSFYKKTEMWVNARKNTVRLNKVNNEIYNQSIVWQFFVLSKKTFKELNFND